MSPKSDIPEPQEVQEMTGRISHLVERSQKIWAETLDRSVDDLATAKHDPLNTMPALTQLTRDYIDQPQKLVEATLEYWTQQTDLWTNIVQRRLGGEDTDGFSLTILRKVFRP
jgi:hypothetical protein